MLENLLVSHRKAGGDVIFLGEVTTGELIAGDQLASMMGLTAGTAQHNVEPWLKWEIDGKTVYYAKKQYRHSLSWDQLNTTGIVNDTQKVVLRGKEYWIGLPKGVNPDTSVPVASGLDVPYSHNSEWNRLMYPIVQATGSDPKLSQVGPNQANYAGAEFGFVDSGYRTWCRETPAGYSTMRVTRGNGSVSYLARIISSDKTMPHGWRPRLELIGDALPAGIFLGEVPVSEMITGDALATVIGLTAGTSQFSNEPWLKFEIDGKIVYYAKKPYRHTVSWDQLSAVNAVDGSRNIVIQGNAYSVSLPKGANPDPSAIPSTGYDLPYSHNSEWNRLMYPITVATALNPKISQYGPNQTSYTEADLVLLSSSGSGGRSWCRETPSGGPSNRVSRGGDSVSRMYRNASSSAAVDWGWRPRLELIA